VRAVEFWAAIATEESQLEPSESLSICLKFKDPLVDMLTSLMLRVSEDDDDNSYSVAQAACVCLTEVVAALGDDIVDKLTAFVSENYAHADWHNRDAAVMALGALLKGPSAEKLKTFLDAGLPSMVARLTGDGKEPYTTVRESVAWVIGASGAQ